MVVRQRDEQEISELFHALADATRRDIVSRVLREVQSVSNLADHYSMSFAAVQKHVALLERAGLVTKESVGRERLVRGDIEKVREVNRLLEYFEGIWRNRLDRFGEVLTDTSKGDK